MRFNQHKGDIRHQDRLKPWSEHVKLSHNGRVVKVVISVLLREKHLTNIVYSINLAFNTAKNL